MTNTIEQTDSVREAFVSPDYRLLHCKCGSYDVGGGTKTVRCYKCNQTFKSDINLNDAIRQWNNLQIQAAAQAQSEKIVQLEATIETMQYALATIGTYPYEGAPDIPMRRIAIDALQISNDKDNQ